MWFSGGSSEKKKKKKKKKKDKHKERTELFFMSFCPCRYDASVNSRLVKLST